VIGDDAHREPTGVEQMNDALQNMVELFLNLACEPRLQLMA